MKDIDRRCFFKTLGKMGTTAVFTTGASGGSLLVPPSIGLTNLNKKLKIVQLNRMMMGTVVSITIIDSSSNKAQKTIEQSFAKIKKLIPFFDRHNGKGPLRTLNKNGYLKNVPLILKYILNISQKLKTITKGSFDITIAPILDIYKKESLIKKKRITITEDLKDLISSIGTFYITKNNHLFFTSENTSITLDGIAKGFIADCIIDLIRKNKVYGALVNAGGDISLMSQNNKHFWNIAITDPQNTKKTKTIIKLRKGAIATSGNYEIYFDNERLFHHIIDPHSGKSPYSNISVSVQAAQATLADALSTACFTMKPNKAINFLEQYNLKGLIYTKHQQRYNTKNFINHF